MSQPENHATNDFSSRFRHILGVRGWDREDVARLTPASWTAVQRWFEGSTPRGDAMIKLAAAIGVNIAWLRDGIGPMLLAIGDDVAPDNRLMEQGVRYGARPGQPVTSVEKLSTDALLSYIEEMPSHFESYTNPEVRAYFLREMATAARELKQRLHK